MKKNLAFLTGIAFLIAILVAVGCGNGTKKDNPPKKDAESTTKAADPTEVAEDLTIVEIYLREIEIGGSMHLLMSDSRKPGFEVIDGLITDVNLGDTVIFMKGKHSRIDEVTDVRLLETDLKINKEKYETEDVIYYRIILNPDVPLSDTLVKYEIEFTVKQDPATYTIDPYLKVPPGSGGNGGT